jgi:adenine-specific DNA-methyltransferase
MNEHPEKLDLTSLDIAAGQREKLRQLFPEAITEGGKVDFDRLKATLGEVVDTGKERYGMNWPGKSECFRTIQAPSRATLRPCREESVNFDTTENLIIEGDNLEALKLLQKGYLGKVKMICIDPPYNTGNEFIYPDNYSESLDTYLSYTGQVDAGGRKFSTNTETDGRFHSKWMNMMYPRLFLARNLLREDGVIFISIDDHEVDNLRKLCNEVFGEDCFLASVIWQKRISPDARASLGAAHDYILVYVKNKTDKKSPLNLLPISLQRSQEFKNPDSDPRGPWASVDLTGQTGHATESQFYNVTSPKGVEFAPPEGRCWALSEKTFQALIADNRIWFGRDGTSRPRQKQFLSETKGMTSWTWWSNEEAGHNQEATKELTALLNEADTFTNPKPIRLIQRVLQLSTNNNTNDLILDFFAGSGTTAHAVLELNKEDGGNRKFILVQLPEPTGREDYKTIADITKERVRRVIQKISRGEEEGLTRRREDAKGEKQLELDAELLIPHLSALKLDSKPLRGFAPSREPGFKVFKLDTSNFKTWDGVRPESPEAVVQQLELHVDHVLAGRTQEDILTELLLKSGFPLCTQVERMEFSRESAKDAKFYYSVEEGTMLICLEKDLTAQMVKELAEKKPSRVICLDAGFQGSDQLKTNAVQTMKARGVLKFQTV